MTKLNPNGKAFTELVLEVFRLNGRLLEAGDRLTQPVGLSSARWQILGVVEHGPITVAHVARIMGLTRQSVQQTANSLEKEGLIEFLENPHHRRSKLMAMTPEGRKALDYTQEQHAVWANKIGEEHDLDCLRAAVDVLRQVSKSLSHE
ncbi:MULTISPECIES: MarR family winged helix-turn-helix transcriptional regulator [Brevibacillus]|uniref:MarR family transcriptional regulator n=1 Tax=Brevibacillus borstelensis AK1 TaxID=1300222 RepID=M8D3M4_9BACL|nr:helix-turn-helix domain-containing protein [Brevibacillus borstelensis]EMT50859.1 MarR family transcriptional regulator [Brevibacillus borstelensis AK1]MCM3470694.1 MarR family transcriptional regulator [Brevibacillus borstelensis]MCM3558964.1 MarR family transcriptional regulator [Brevibacillus borstelensis]MCM3593139.1 MarR family transcriptional regulator [Brevibacillus borstelensis]MCM3622033.1 MarR family transcriptional regulator [Brevibacillus borstelensis]